MFKETLAQLDCRMVNQFVEEINGFATSKFETVEEWDNHARYENRKPTEKNENGCNSCHPPMGKK